MPRPIISTSWNETRSEGRLSDNSANLITDDSGNYIVLFIGSGLPTFTTLWT